MSLPYLPFFRLFLSFLFFREGSESGDSLDGAPINNVGGRVSPAPAPPAGAFIKSKWETVDPEQVSYRKIFSVNISAAIFVVNRHNFSF